MTKERDWTRLLFFRLSSWEKDRDHSRPSCFPSPACGRGQGEGSVVQRSIAIMAARGGLPSPALRAASPACGRGERSHASAEAPLLPSFAHGKMQERTIATTANIVLSPLPLAGEGRVRAMWFNVPIAIMAARARLPSPALRVASLAGGETQKKAGSLRPFYYCDFTNTIRHVINACDPRRPFLAPSAAPSSQRRGSARCPCRLTCRRPAFR